MDFLDHYRMPRVINKTSLCLLVEAWASPRTVCALGISRPTAPYFGPGSWSFTTLVPGLLVDDGSTDWRNSFSAEFPLVWHSAPQILAASAPCPELVMWSVLSWVSLSLCCDLRSVNRQKAEEDRGFVSFPFILSRVTLLCCLLADAE